MKSGSLIYGSSSNRILLVVLAILFTLCAAPAIAASASRTVTIVVGDEPETLDPSFSTHGAVGRVLMGNVLEPLTEINPNDRSISPRLAAFWKRTDANTWLFSLRKGVKFHDGADFNAEAVLFNIKRLYDNRLKSHIRGKLFSTIKMEGKALDSHAVEIKTEKPEYILPTLLGYLTMCSPNTPMDKWVRQPVGTGPYKLVKWDAGTQIILERFDGYWGPQPEVEKAVYLWRKESTVQASMVAIGEADLAPIIAVQDANRPDLDYSYFNAETTRLKIVMSEPPLNDRRVRMALNHAVDRTGLRGSVFSKDVVPATQLVVPSTFGHNPELKVWPYDPEKAKALLAEARKDGVPVDKEILLVGRINVYPNATEAMEAMAAMYKAIGLNVKMKMLEAGVYFTYHNKPIPKDLAFLVQDQHDNNNGDPVFTVWNKYSCEGVQSTTCDKTLDEMIQKAQAAIGEERKNLWRLVFKRINDEIIADVPMFHMVGYTRVGNRINFKPTVLTNSQVQLSQITFKK